MKEKSQAEKSAEEKQTTLLSAALSEAANAGGHWLNAAGKGYPRFYPKGVSVSPFNALFLSLHSDRNGCKTNLFTLYNETKARGASVREHEQGVPFIYYNWNRYVNRNNPEEIISRAAYQALDAEQQKQYKGVHNCEIRTLFNIDQTTLPYVDKEAYADILKEHGSAEERGFGETEERRLRNRFNDFLQKMRDNLVAVRSDASGVAHYETDRDAVYLPRQREFEHYNDYVQETLRQIVRATGHQERLAREGMVMKNGTAPSEDAVKHEKLVVELASGIKMLELGLPARLTPESLEMVDYWNRELREDPCMMDAIESDVNNALEVMRKAERGEKIEYATYINRRQTSEIRQTLPKHYFVADEIRQHPDRESKRFVIVVDREKNRADVILPAGASLEAKNEVPGMSKERIEKALNKMGVGQVQFFNADGALGYRPDDSYFAEKEISVARIKNWALETLATLDASSAVKRANELGFDQVQMIQDDKNRWALYIKPENKEGYSIYPDKEDVNRFFATLKQSLDNIEKVRMELAQKYSALAEKQPDLKVDLFRCDERDIDLNRIQRVSVFKTKKDGVLCAATIDGQKMQPRSITPQQWQRMWIAEDRQEYKRHLAATLFADVLRRGQTQEQTAGEKQEREAEQKQGESVVQKNAEQLALPKQWEEVKANHPDALILVGNNVNYRLYNADAVKASEILNLPLHEHPESANGITASVEFEYDKLDTYLPKLVRAGERVAIAHDLPQEKVSEEQEMKNDAEQQASRGMHR